MQIGCPEEGHNDYFLQLYCISGMYFTKALQGYLFFIFYMKQTYAHQVFGHMKSF